MNDEIKVGEARAGFEKAEPMPRTVELARQSMMRFEAQKAAERDELTARERAAIEAVKEWRAADEILLKARADYEQLEAGGEFTRDELVQAYIGLMRLVHAEEAKRTSLRASADELLKGEG